jgi:hypothetical protein
MATSPTKPEADRTEREDTDSLVIVPHQEVWIVFFFWWNVGAVWQLT